MHSNLVLGDVVGRASDEQQTTPGHFTFFFLLRGIGISAEMPNWPISGLRYVGFKSWVFVFKTRSFSPDLLSSQAGIQGKLLYVKWIFVICPSLVTVGTKDVRRIDKTKSAPAPPTMAMALFISIFWHLFFPKELSPLLNLTSLSAHCCREDMVRPLQTPRPAFSYFLLHFS